jgi:hypothetical protein
MEVFAMLVFYLPIIIFAAMLEAHANRRNDSIAVFLPAFDNRSARDHSAAGRRDPLL